MQSNEPTRAPSVQHMSYRPDHESAENRGGNWAQTARTLSAQTAQSTIKNAIIAKCDEIENRPLRSVPVDLRRDFGALLVHNQLMNPGGLTERQENLCAWVLLEFTAANTNQVVSGRQFRSFVNPNNNDQLTAVARTASMLNVLPEHFAD